MHGGGAGPAPFRYPPAPLAARLLSEVLLPEAAHPLYPRLFTPLTVGGITLPNRVLMGSMHVGLEEERGRLEKLAGYFAARAAGGVGLIVTGGVAPNHAGALKPFAAKLSNRYEVWKHRAVTDAVHAEGGRIALQILDCEDALDPAARRQI